MVPEGDSAGALILPTAVPGHGRPSDPTPGDGPRVDYHELARALGGRVLFPEAPPGPAGALERRTRRLGYWHLARRAHRCDPPVIVSLSEKIGMCVSLLGARTPHVVVAHNLTTPKRRAFQRATRWLSRPDRILVLSYPQEAYLRQQVGLADERVRLVRHHVDDRFFLPQGGPEEGYVLSVGQTGRDYATLMEAVRVSGFPTVLVASSRWIDDRGRNDVPVPPNVTLRHGLTDQELRALYDRASVVAVPLQPGLDWAAGVTGVLEAMAMRKPLVVSSTPGLDGYTTHGVDALCVPAGDAVALRTAIVDLLDDRPAANRLADAARAKVEADLSLDAYVSTVASVVGELPSG